MWLEDDKNYLSRIDYDYYDGADTTWLNSIQYVDKFEYPAILTNGLAYRMGDYMTVACDFDIQLFKGQYQDIGLHLELQHFNRQSELCLER